MKSGQAVSVLKVLSAMIVLSLAAFSAPATAAPAVRYFKGKIQRTSADGRIPYGPAFSSLARRAVDLKVGRISECVLQEGKVFVTTLTATATPLVYSASDASGSFTGTVTFEDATLSAWSYDLQVTKPTAGHLTGDLGNGGGARIDAKSGVMTITKFWDDKVRIHEEYQPISKAEYSAAAPSECAE